MEIDNKLIEKIKNEGRAVINNIIEKEKLDFCKKVINKKTLQGKANSTVIPISKVSLTLKLLKFQFNQILDSIKLKQISQNLNLLECSEKILEKKTILDSIDLYKSNKSEEQILPWHCDQSYSGKTIVKNTHPDEGYLKFFFYLTDVDSNNGCLGYIPKSHKITYYLKICFYNNELKYEPFWSLSDMRELLCKKNVRNELKKYLKLDVIDEFIENSNFANSGNKDTLNYDLKVSAGGVLIFNELGYHRAACPSKNDRYALRYFYRKIS